MDFDEDRSVEKYLKTVRPYGGERSSLSFVDVHMK